MMKTSKPAVGVTTARTRAGEALRDPAVWAWLAVALLAIVPATAALAHLYTR